MVAQDRLYNLIGIFLLGWLLVKLAPILTPFIAAGLLAYIGDPLVDKLETFKIRRTLSVVIVFFGLTLGFILLIALLGPMIKTQVGGLAEKLPGYIEVLWSQLVSEYGDKLSGVGSNLLKGIGKSSANLLGAFFSLLLTPILAFYLLRDWDIMVARIGALIPRRYQAKAFTLAKESDQALGSFLRGQLIVMLGLSIIYSAGLLILGVENALAIGILSGIVSFVPYLGFIVGIGLASLTAFASGGSPMLLVGVLAVFGTSSNSYFCSNGWWSIIWFLWYSFSSPSRCSIICIRPSFLC